METAMVLSEKLKKTIELAREEAMCLQTYYVGIAHVMLGLLRNDGSSAKRIIIESGVAVDKLQADLRKSVYPFRDEGLYLYPEILPFTREAKEIFDHAAEIARENGKDEVSTGNLLAAIVSLKDSGISGILRDHGLIPGEITSS
jgi:ATP-dependent Clp protease ATP-binding subunit ClpA